MTIPSRPALAYRPLAVPSPYDVIDAVNALRTSYGLTPYRISPILMYTAQAQADFMASSEDVTHSGPGGMGLTDRLLAAGYPLAGDISAGGFRAENVTSENEERSAVSVVEGWSGDALHLNTMISPSLSEIGAGVAVANGRVYFVIDCALPTTDLLSQGATVVAESESTVPIPVAVLSTPNPDGDVIHEVKPGESLWQLALAYEVKIDDIKRLNNLFDDTLYPGSKLLIKQRSTPATPTVTAAASTQPSITPTTTTITFTSTEVASWTSKSSSPGNKNSILYTTLGILLLALLGGGVVAWLGSRTKRAL